MTTTDDEEFDKIKDFWAQYGKTLIWGITLGLIIVAGWLGWQNWQSQRQTEAAQAFHQIEQLRRANKPEAAMQAARKLAASDQSTVYATLALMIGAHEAMSQNDPEKARLYLQDAIKNTRQPGLIALARLRLARVEWAQNQPDAALATLKNTPPAPYAALYAELAGDIQASQKNWSAARQSYEQALSNPATAGGLVQIKLDNLPAATPTATQTITPSGISPTGTPQ